MVLNQPPMPAHDDDDEPARDGAERLLQELTRQAEAEGVDLSQLAVEQGRAALGASLLSLRAARGLSQTELAQLSGVEQADISRIERAAVDPRASTLLRLLSGLAARITFSLEQDGVEPRWTLVDEETALEVRPATARVVQAEQSTQDRRAAR